MFVEQPVHRSRPKTAGKRLKLDACCREEKAVGALPSLERSMKESAIISEKKQSLLKGKICRPHFPSSWEPGQRCDNVQNRERERSGESREEGGRAER